MQRDEIWEQLCYDFPNILWTEKQVWRKDEGCIPMDCDPDYEPADGNWMNISLWN